MLQKIIQIQRNLSKTVYQGTDYSDHRIEVDVNEKSYGWAVFMSPANSVLTTCPLRYRRNNNNNGSNGDIRVGAKFDVGGGAESESI